MKRKSTFYWIFAGLLLAISVVFKAYLDIPITFMGSFVKDINLSPAIIMYCGIILGPLGGSLVGAGTDLIVYFLRTMGSYNPLFTLTNALIGLIPSLFYRKTDLSLRPKLGRLTFAITLTQLICSALCNTLILIIFFGLPMQVAPVRALSSFVLDPIYIAIIYALLQASTRFMRKANFTEFGEPQ